MAAKDPEVHTLTRDGITTAVLNIHVPLGEAWTWFLNAACNNSFISLGHTELRCLSAFILLSDWRSANVMIPQALRFYLPNNVESYVLPTERVILKTSVGPLAGPPCLVSPPPPPHPPRSDASDGPPPYRL